jgi:hypothetical protein
MEKWPFAMVVVDPWDILSNTLPCNVLVP